MYDILIGFLSTCAVVCGAATTLVWCIMCYRFGLWFLYSK